MHTFKTLFVLIVFYAFANPIYAMADNISKPEVMTTYSWRLNDEDSARLFERVKSLRYGDAVSKVKEELGRPTKEGDNFDKKGNFIEHELLYAVKRVKPEGGSVMDQEISLNFDMQGQLFRIGYNAMPPLVGEIVLSGTEPQTGTKFFMTKPPVKLERSQ